MRPSLFTLASILASVHLIGCADRDAYEARIALLENQAFAYERQKEHASAFAREVVRLDERLAELERTLSPTTAADALAAAGIRAEALHTPTRSVIRLAAADAPRALTLLLDVEGRALTSVEVRGDAAIVTLPTIEIPPRASPEPLPPPGMFTRALAARASALEAVVAARAAELEALAPGTSNLDARKHRLLDGLGALEARTPDRLVSAGRWVSALLAPPVLVREIALTAVAPARGGDDCEEPRPRLAFTIVPADGVDLAAVNARLRPAAHVVGDGTTWVVAASVDDPEDGDRPLLVLDRLLAQANPTEPAACAAYEARVVAALSAVDDRALAERLRGERSTCARDAEVRAAIAAIAADPPPAR